MADGTTRMGNNMLEEAPATPVSSRRETAANRYSQPAPTQPTSFWGSLPQGVRTIIKVALVAVVAYAAVSLAMPYLMTNFPAAAAYLTPVAEVFGAVGSGITSAVNSALALFGLSPLGTALAPAAAAVLPQAVGVTAATAAGAATLAASAKTATVVGAAAASAATTPVLTAPPSVLDTSISAQTAQIDPSALNTMAAKKSATLASLDNFDLPENAFQQNAGHATEKAAKLAQVAEDIREKEIHRRAGLQRIQDKIASWQERVGTNKEMVSPAERVRPAAHSERIQQRDSSFANSINADRERLDNALSHA